MPGADVTAVEVQKLRQAAGVGMMDAKRALSDAGGDFDDAFRLLRERGLAATRKRAGREANDGTIGSYIHVQADRPVIGVIVELACETDFVAKSDEFNETANRIAMHIAAANPRWIGKEDVPAEALEKEREILTARARGEGKPDHVIGRIVEGRVASFYTDNVLYEQPFVNPEQFDGTVGTMVEVLAAKMGENISVRRISRLAVGDQAE